MLSQAEIAEVELHDEQSQNLNTRNDRINLESSDKFIANSVDTMPNTNTGVLEQLESNSINNNGMTFSEYFVIY